MWGKISVKEYKKYVSNVVGEFDGINQQINALAETTVDLFPFIVGDTVYRKGSSDRFEIVSIGTNYGCPYRPDVELRKKNAWDNKTFRLKGEISKDRRNWVLIG